MVTDLRKKHRAPRDAQGTRPARVDSTWPYVLAAIALIVVVVVAVLMLTQRPEAARARTGSYAELARAEAREGGPYVQTPDPCDAFETIPGQGGQPVRLPCERSDEPSETPEERNWVEIREGGPYACTVSLPPCWDPAHDPLRGDLHR